MIGQTFNCLTVTGRESTIHGLLWVCQCSCGKETYARSYDLQNGKKKSCGHLRTEHNKKFKIAFRKLTRWDAIGIGQSSVGWNVDDVLDELGSL